MYDQSSECEELEYDLIVGRTELFTRTDAVAQSPDPRRQEDDDEEKKEDEENSEGRCCCCCCYHEHSTSIDSTAAAVLVAATPPAGDHGRRLVPRPEDATVIDLEGIATLCEGLALDPEADIRVLLLIWKFQCCPGPHDADDDDAATQRGNGGDGGGGVPGQISQQEFLRGCSRFQIYSLHTMQTRFLPSLDTGFLDRHEFKGFYKVSVIYIYTETVY